MSPFQNVKVVGMQFRGEGAKALVAAFVPPVALTLEREATNEHDANAIKVFYGEHHIGYIEASQAMWIAPKMDEGKNLVAEVVRIDTTPRVRYPIVTISEAESEAGELETKVDEPELPFGAPSDEG